MDKRSVTERIFICRPPEYPGLESIAGPPLPYSSDRHMHEELEIALNQGRSWQMGVHGRNYWVAANEIVLTAPEEPHAASSLETGSGEYVGLRIHPDLLRVGVKEITERPADMLYFDRIVVDDALFYSVLLAFHQAMRGKECARIERDTMLQAIVLYLMRSAKDANVLPEAGYEHGAVRKAKAYMHENYQQDISLQALSTYVGLSPFYLSRVFHAQSGLPPHAYLMQVRVTQAKKLLMEGLA